MARIRRSAAARRDADEIWLSIAIDSEAAAERLMRRFEAAEDRLADFPELGPIHPDLGSDARYWVVGDYLILYRVSAGDVEIVRIIHGARDLGEAFPET